MRKPELADPFTRPGGPDLRGPGGRRRGVSLQDRHLVAIPAQQQSSTQADDPGTGNHDPGDGYSLPSRAALRESPDATMSQVSRFSLRQPPARLLAMMCLIMAVRAAALMVSPARTATVRAVLLPWPAVMIPSGSGTMAPS
jgi:hypothetical protein